jgi:hypothetical protein
MADEYIYVIGQDGEIYEFRPTEALLSFLRRMAEDEAEEQKKDQCGHNLTNKKETFH